VRAYYGHDPIPALLPSVISFCHTGQAIWFTVDGQMVRHDRPALLNIKILSQYAAAQVFNCMSNPYVDHNRQLMSDAMARHLF
jgi:hypothetical protein